jgi:hypothetical protein
MPVIIYGGIRMEKLGNEQTHKNGQNKKQVISCEFTLSRQNSRFCFLTNGYPTIFSSRLANCRERLSLRRFLKKGGSPSFAYLKIYKNRDCLGLPQIPQIFPQIFADPRILFAKSAGPSAENERHN